MPEISARSDLGGRKRTNEKEFVNRRSAVRVCPSAQKKALCRAAGRSLPPVEVAVLVCRDDRSMTEVRPVTRAGPTDASGSETQRYARMLLTIQTTQRRAHPSLDG